MVVFYWEFSLYIFCENQIFSNQNYHWKKGNELIVVYVQQIGCSIKVNYFLSSSQPMSFPINCRNLRLHLLQQLYLFTRKRFPLELLSNTKAFKIGILFAPKQVQNAIKCYGSNEDGDGDGGETEAIDIDLLVFIVKNH